MMDKLCISGIVINIYCVSRYPNTTLHDVPTPAKNTLLFAATTEGSYCPSLNDLVDK